MLKHNVCALLALSPPSSAQLPPLEHAFSPLLGVLFQLPCVPSPQHALTLLHQLIALSPGAAAPSPPPTALFPPSLHVPVVPSGQHVHVLDLLSPGPFQLLWPPADISLLDLGKEAIGKPLFTMAIIDPAIV